MGKKLILAALAMLGFAGACSTAKKSAKSEEPELQPQPAADVNPAIKVMYGVRRPYPVLNAEEIGAADSTATAPATKPAEEESQSAKTE